MAFLSFVCKRYCVSDNDDGEIVTPLSDHCFRKLIVRDGEVVSGGYYRKDNTLAIGLIMGKESKIVGHKLYKDGFLVSVHRNDSNHFQQYILKLISGRF